MASTTRPNLYDQDDPFKILEPVRQPAPSGDHYAPVVGAQLLRKAEVFAEAADLALDEDHEMAAMLAALAGVTAADATCSIRLGRRSSPLGHRDAPRLLARAEPDNTEVVSVLQGLLRIREAATRSALTRMEARRAVAHARWLLDHAGRVAFGSGV